MDKPITEKDSYISYLPAAHSFEQGLFAMTLVYGMRCGVFAGNVVKLTEDVQILKPTIFPSVPRLLNRIHSKLKAKMEDILGVKGWLLNQAVKSKISYYHRGKGLTHILYDPTIFNSMKRVLGGNVRMMITS